MTPQAFIEKWRDVELKERSASQSHFNDLCRLLEVLDPQRRTPRAHGLSDDLTLKRFAEFPRQADSSFDLQQAK